MFRTGKAPEICNFLKLNGDEDPEQTDEKSVMRMLKLYERHNKTTKVKSWVPIQAQGSQGLQKPTFRHILSKVATRYIGKQH